MQKLGLVGGLAWISTAEYYAQLHRLIEAGVDSVSDHSRPSSFEMSIESLDLQKALSLAGTEDDDSSWLHFDAYHRDALLRLEQSGARCAAIASNTPHIRYDYIIKGVEIPVIDMFASVAKEVADQGAKQALILGTSLTMRSDRFKEVLSSHGVQPIPTPSQEIISEVADVIRRLQAGRIQGCAEALNGIVKRLRTFAPGVQPHVILSCTELALAFPERTSDRVFVNCNISYIDSMAVHIQTILRWLLSPITAQNMAGMTTS